LDNTQNLPDANEWGWRIANGDVYPLWMTLPEASKGLSGINEMWMQEEVLPKRCFIYL
jgi:hypothetical protein